ncbi:MAG: TonB family protein [Pseudomonadota bacterium]
MKIDPEEFPRELPQLTDPVDPVPEPQDVARLPVQPEKETVPPEPAATAEDLPVDLPRTAVEPVEAPSKPVRSETRAKAEEANKEQEAKRQRAAKDQKPKRAKIAEKVVKPQRADAKNAEKTTKKASRASTSASNNTAPVQQRVTSASKGALRVFARKIARALARSRPGRITITGTVVVAFTLSSRGTLGSVRVRKSSGSSRVDRAAMRAVRRAKFPGPPKGATRKQRSFVVPYHFCRR